MRFRITVDGESHDIEVEDRGTALTVRVDGAEYRSRVTREPDGFAIRVGRRRHRVAVQGHRVRVDGEVHEVSTEPLGGSEPIEAGAIGAHAAAVVEVRPPMPGRVVKLLAAAGANVRRGQTLAVLEAMKMQNEISAPADAVVRSIGVKEGETIAGDRVIAVLETR